ncbi:MAG TPA: DegV family protein [Chloroflexia bacterium]|nr:DegV family protein [Chloroflexia bacterium]
MPNIRVVTDSTCDLPDALIRQHGITVLPVTLQQGSQTFLDRVHLSTDEVLRPAEPGPFSTTPPSPTAFEQVYRRLQQARPCDGVVSIHVSARLSATYQAAVAARDAARNSAFPVGVVDSESASMGLGLIVLAAAHAAATGASWTEVMKAAQRAKGQTHVAAMVDSLEGLLRSGRFPRLVPPGEPAPVLKPVLRLDDGQLVLLERTRTRHKALDSLCAFVEDFPHIAALVLLHGAPLPEQEALLNRLALVCPRDRIQVVQYGAAHAAYVGGGAVGVAVYEGDAAG